MNKLIDAALQDLSTKNFFLFQIHCASCGKDYANRPVRFSKAGCIPQTREEQILYEAIYQQECHASRQNAVRQIGENMNECPICKRLVCNGCFRICEDIDMCKGCAAELKETGVSVLSNEPEKGI